MPNYLTAALDDGEHVVIREEMLDGEDVAASYDERAVDAAWRLLNGSCRRELEMAHGLPHLPRDHDWRGCIHGYPRCQSCDRAHLARGTSTDVCTASSARDAVPCHDCGLTLHVASHHTIYDCCKNLRSENERLTWKVLGLESTCDEVKRYKAETERQLQVKIAEIGTLLEEVNILRHRLCNLTFDDLSDAERVRAIGRTLG